MVITTSDQRHEELIGVNILPKGWRNFDGKKYKDGKGYFNVGLTEEDYLTLKDIGYQVEMHDPREEGDEPLYTLKVKIGSFQKWPPEIKVINEDGKMFSYGESDMERLNGLSMLPSDVVIRRYYFNDKLSAYLDSAYFKMRTTRTDLQRRYDDQWKHQNEEPLPFE